MAVPGAVASITGDARPLLQEMRRADTFMSAMSRNWEQRFARLNRSGVTPNIGRGFTRLDRDFSRLDVGANKLFNTLDRMGRTLTAGLGFGVAAGGLNLLERAFDKAITKARDFETAVLSISAARASAFNVQTRSGVPISGEGTADKNLKYGFMYQQSQAGRINKELIKRAASNILTYEEQLGAFLVTTSVSARKGLTEKQQLNLSEYLAVAAKSLKMSGQQITQQVRVVTSGQNVPRSVLGPNIGLDRPSEQKKLRELTGDKYYDFLIGKVKGFLAGQPAFAESIEGTLAQIESKFDILGAKIGQKFVRKIRPALNDLDDAFASGEMDRFADDVATIFVNIAKVIESIARSPALPMIRNFIEFIANNGSNLLILVGLSKMLGFLTHLVERGRQLRATLTQIGAIRVKPRPELDSGTISTTPRRRGAAASFVPVATPRGAAAERGGIPVGAQRQMDGKDVRSIGRYLMPGYRAVPVTVQSFGRDAEKAINPLEMRERAYSRYVRQAAGESVQRGSATAAAFSADRQRRILQDLNPRTAGATGTPSVAGDIPVSYIMNRLRARNNASIRALQASLAEADKAAFSDRVRQQIADKPKDWPNGKPWMYQVRAARKSAEDIAYRQALREQGFRSPLMYNMSKFGLKQTAQWQMAEMGGKAGNVAARVSNSFQRAGPNIMPSVLNASLAYGGTSLANMYADGQDNDALSIATRAGGFGLTGALLGSPFRTGRPFAKSLIRPVTRALRMPGLGTSMLRGMGRGGMSLLGPIGFGLGGIAGISDWAGNRINRSERMKGDAEDVQAEMRKENPLLAQYMHLWGEKAKLLKGRLTPAVKAALAALTEEMGMLNDAAGAVEKRRQIRKGAAEDIVKQKELLRTSENLFGDFRRITQKTIQEKIDRDQIEIDRSAGFIQPRPTARLLAEQMFGNAAQKQGSTTGLRSPEDSAFDVETDFRKREAGMKSTIDDRRLRIQKESIVAESQGREFTAGLLSLQEKLLSLRQLFDSDTKGQADFETMAKSSVDRYADEFKIRLTQSAMGLRDLQTESRRLKESFADTRDGMRRNVVEAQNNVPLTPLNMLSAENPLRQAVDKEMAKRREEVGLANLRQMFPADFTNFGEVQNLGPGGKVLNTQTFQSPLPSTQTAKALSERFGGIAESGANIDVADAKASRDEAQRKLEHYIQDAGIRMSDLAYHIGIGAKEFARLSSEIGASSEQIFAAMASFKLDPVRAEIKAQIDVPIAVTISEVMNKAKIEQIAAAAIHKALAAFQQQASRDAGRSAPGYGDGAGTRTFGIGGAKY